LTRVAGVVEVISQIVDMQPDCEWPGRPAPDLAERSDRLEEHGRQIEG